MVKKIIHKVESHKIIETVLYLHRKQKDLIKVKLEWRFVSFLLSDNLIYWNKSGWNLISYLILVKTYQSYFFKFTDYSRYLESWKF